MQLHIKAKHFAIAAFCETRPVVVAAKELFNEPHFVENDVDRLVVGGKVFSHEEYGYDEFLYDQEDARIYIKAFNNPEAILTTLNLTELCESLESVEWQ